jgi:hypothetical protein
LAQTGCLSGALLLGLAMSGVVLWFAILRESLEFWRNEGGYPVELRDLVHQSFYPLSLATIAGLGLIGWALLRRSRLHPAVWATHAALLVVCGMLLVAAAVVAFANNVSNLWNGRPLHSHPEQIVPGEM